MTAAPYELKAIVFLAAFLLLVWLGKKLSAVSEVHAYYEAPLPPDPLAPDSKNQPALTGAELPFPISLPPIVRKSADDYNRPKVVNYYFSHIDLVAGPPDPVSFCDQLFLVLQDPGNDFTWTSDYTVATPAGLQQEMDTTHSTSLTFDNKVIVVARWDMSVIMQTIMDEIMANYATQDPPRELPRWL